MDEDIDLARGDSAILFKLGYTITIKICIVGIEEVKKWEDTQVVLL